MLFKVILLIWFLLAVSAVKDRQTRRARANDNLEEEDRSRSLDDWNAVPIGTLRLRCNFYNISPRGSSDILAARLYHHFHRPPALDGLPGTINVSQPVNASVAVPVVATSNQSILVPGVTQNAITISDVRNEFRLMIPELVSALSGVHPSVSVNVPVPVITNANPNFNNPNPSSTNPNSNFDNGNNENTVAANSNNLNTVAANPNVNTVPANTFNPFSGVDNYIATNSLGSLLNFHPASRHNSDILPPLDEKIINTIKQGKFVEFDSLLPQPHSSSSMQGFIIQQEGEACSVIPRSQQKSRIVNFYHWFVAWSIFARVYIHFHGHRVREIMHYQAQMAHFASLYVFNDIYLFDIQFRHRIANDPLLRWDRTDVELNTLYIRNAKPVCWHCNKPGHFHGQCPSTPVSSTVTGAAGAGPRPRLGASPRFPRAPARAPGPSTIRQSQPGQAFGSGFAPQHTCWYFNTNGFCNNNRCAHVHACSGCGGSHPLSHCTQRHTARN